MLVGSAVLMLVTLGFMLPEDQSPTTHQAGLHPIQQMYYLKKMKPDVKRVGVIWKKGAAKQEQKLNVIKRAIASIQGKLFLGYVTETSDVGEKFRLLTRKHDVQALWVVENDGIVNSSAPRQYLIKNAVQQGIPLLAPTKDWVTAGAPFAIEKSGGSYRILMNEPAAKATSLDVPEKYKSKTKLVAVAN